VSFLENTESYRRDLRRVEYGAIRDARIPTRISSVNNGTRSRRAVVVHGRNDPRVPYTEAEQIVTAARKNGVIVVPAADTRATATRGKRRLPFYAMIEFIRARLLSSSTIGGITGLVDAASRPRQRAQAEWLWIDWFSASTVSSKRLSASAATRRRARDPRRSADCRARSVRFVGALQIPYSLHDASSSAMRMVADEHGCAAERSAPARLCAPYSEISFEHGHNDVTGAAMPIVLV
jgi:hypothetical protein